MPSLSEYDTPVLAEFGIARHYPRKVPFQRVDECRDRRNVESQRLGRGNVTHLSSEFQHLAGQDYVHLTHAGPHIDGLHIVIYEVAVGGDRHRIQPDSPVCRRGFHIAAEHFPAVFLKPFVTPQRSPAGIVFHRFLSAHPKAGAELLFSNERGIGTEGIDAGQVPLQEHFEAPVRDERRRVRSDPRQEAPITFVTAQFPLAIAAAGDMYIVQPDRIPEGEHARIEA